MPALLTETDWRRLDATGAPIGVDRRRKIIRGYVVAEMGPFKTPGRGEFDEQSLETIVKLIKATPNGLKSRFAHPGLSSDGIGKFLGRARNPRVVLGQQVRADLHLDPTSFDTPSGNLGGYVMRLAESDPDAFSSSLVLQTDKVPRRDARGRPERDARGKELPPIWRPTELHASDVVDTGDAVDGFLSIDGLPDEAVRIGSKAIDRQFPSADRETITNRCNAWLDRYLDGRFGDENSTGMADRERRRAGYETWKRRFAVGQYKHVLREATRPWPPSHPPLQDVLLCGVIPVGVFGSHCGKPEIINEEAFDDVIRLGLTCRILLDHDFEQEVASTDSGLTLGLTYTYEIRATDTAGNRLPKSTAATVTVGP